MTISLEDNTCFQHAGYIIEHAERHILGISHLYPKIVFITYIFTSVVLDISTKAAHAKSFDPPSDRRATKITGHRTTNGYILAASDPRDSHWRSLIEWGFLAQEYTAK